MQKVIQDIELHFRTIEPQEISVVTQLTIYNKHESERYNMGFTRKGFNQ